MRASRPTVARVVAALPLWPETQNLFVGAGFIPPGVFAPPQASRAHNVRPYRGRDGVGFAVGRRFFPRPVGADSISARKLRATANRADIESAPTIYPPKYLSPPKKPETPPTHKTQKPKNQKSPPKTTTPARQPFSLNGRRAGFSCQVFLATLITGYPVCPCVFCPQAAPQWPPPPRSARRAPPPAGTCRWSAARTTARRSASGLRPRCRP